MSALARLLLLNREGKLSSVTKGGRGFYDSRNAQKRRRLCGIGTFLHEKTSVFPKLSLKEYRKKRAIKPERPKKGQVKRRASNKRKGESFHRHVHHALFCAQPPCQCPDGEVKRRPAKDSDAYNMVRGALKFLRDQQLSPLAGETVVACATVPLGTRFDCLARDTNAQNVLVSWKTGYDSIARVAPSPLKGEFMQADEDDRKKASSETIALREHIAQLCCELHMLRDEHGVCVERAMIVYLSPSTDDYRVIEMTRDWVISGYQQSWRWMLQHSVF